MKKQKQLIHLGVLAVLLGGVVAPLAQPFSPVTSVAAEGPITTKEIPATTKINIYKLRADSYSKLIENRDGQKLSAEALKELGTNVTPLKGVTFKWYKITDGATDDMLRKMTKEELDVKYTKNGSTGVTDSEGLTSFSVSKEDNGTYWVIEESAPATVSSAYAVPFRISFPMGTSDGSGYLSEVNVYPKNVESSFPVPDKDVESVGQNEGSYNIGDAINFHLKGTIPKNIHNYSKYQFDDTLDPQLDYEGIGDVKVGTKILTVNEHYTVDWSADTRTVKVSLTEAGLKWVSDNVPVANRGQQQDNAALDKAENTDAAPYIDVTLKAKINDKAVLGKPIANKTQIEFNNRGGNHGEELTPPPGEDTPPPGTPGVPPTTPPAPPGEDTPPPTPPTPPVYVYTGGKKFVKVGEKETDKLAGAEFKLYDNKEAVEAMKWTAGLLAANKDAIATGKFVNATEGKEIILKSATDGSFEIKGLKYDPIGTTGELATAGNGSKKYYLQEIKAPAGYVVLADRIEFEVNQTSYNKTPTTIESNTGDADPQNVKNNKRPNIPHTGGIGTIIFVVSGLALMGLALFGLKKDKKHS
ncbi:MULTISPECIES: SpaH/EbpB family LPXTG-anchored major pilin [Streptococcus]|uniref:SpaH/EbpB family LPXTG-anchored major pilin n=1 Tax=Streptococcus zhangguiae TaxID=2664091 RepID=A0A6I4RAZ5_9STRE|nr:MULTISPECIES: SpaH/EbpB family LPXTG-anchored major pilin [unclassified Streptococcus]MWV57006.1 SpaH/EbpB family LPXTG-anchored major pilin [Streptococcus sp. zg-70]QTH47572.1 SpaH/EbpB family LPXTG-anchored major pilin [Streptococcus sp. zg-86]